MRGNPWQKLLKCQCYPRPTVYLTSCLAKPNLKTLNLLKIMLKCYYPVPAHYPPTPPPSPPTTIENNLTVLLTYRDLGENRSQTLSSVPQPHCQALLPTIKLWTILVLLTVLYNNSLHLFTNNFICWLLVVEIHILILILILLKKQEIVSLM